MLYPELAGASGNNCLNSNVSAFSYGYVVHNPNWPMFRETKLPAPRSPNFALRL